MNQITLTINGQKVTVPVGLSVLEAAEYVGISIPTFCHDPELVKPGACRICVVEIEGIRNLPASCVTQATNGMIIETESPNVFEARKTILELLMANHPKDCMTCEKSGDCRLQTYCYQYGVEGVVFSGDRHDYPLDDSNPYILRDNNKCITCGKCVRTCAQVKDRAVIDFSMRGFNTKITPALDTSLADSDCVYCGRCVAICPVGALVDKSVLGKGRTWEIEQEQITCSFCDAGCYFNVNKKNGKVIGVTAKSPGEGRPLCLKGRLGTDFIYNPDCTEQPMIKKDGQFVQVPWDEALGLNEIFAKIKRLEVRNNE